MVIKNTFVGFHTGLWAFDYSDYPPFPYKAKNWRLELLAPDEKRNLTSMTRGNETIRARELAIFAPNSDSAQRAADLIHSSRLLLDGSNIKSHLVAGDHHRIRPVNETGPEDDEFDPDLRSEWYDIATVHIPLAGMVAAKASFKLEWVYALAKLRVSIELASAPTQYLDPEQSENIPKSVFPQDHVRMAHALIAAWSCVEELGFEVRASVHKPSKLPDGSWNPSVKTDLEARLRRGGVDLTESFLWNLRGPRTRIEKKKAPQLFTKAEWARWNVRDGGMRLIDAINYVSYMRSSIAAHKSDKELIRVLSIYDVANAQSLARRLLLQRLGFWRYGARRARSRSV